MKIQASLITLLIFFSIPQNPIKMNRKKNIKDLHVPKSQKKKENI